MGIGLPLPASAEPAAALTFYDDPSSASQESSFQDQTLLLSQQSPEPLTHQSSLLSMAEHFLLSSRNRSIEGGESYDPFLLQLEDGSNFSLQHHNSSHLFYGDNNNGNLTEQKQDQVLFSLGFQIFIYIIYNVVFVAALLGNILVCYVVFSSPRMRTVTNYLIANLAVGDLLMALLCVPFSYISVLLQYWPFGEVLCHVVAPAQAVCVFVSAYTLVALAGDRYMAILYPLKPRLRRSQALIVIFIVWVIAIVTAMPIAIFTGMKTERGLPVCSEVRNGF
jgi:hypothetical protein